MAKRKRKSSDSFTRFNVTVEAASARIGRLGPDTLTLAPEGEADSTIEIEGPTDKPAIKDIGRVVIFVHCEDDAKGNPGGAIDVNVVWQVVVALEIGSHASPRRGRSRACVKRPNQIPLFVATREVDDGSVH